MVSPLLTRLSTTGGRPIFCHFLNRELHDSLARPFNVSAYLEAIRLCTIFHSEPLFCNFSQLCEVAYQHDDLMSEISALTKCDAFLPCSDFDRVTEFLDSRRRLYEHDRARYGLYFTTESSSFFSGIKPARVDTGGTTAFIADAVEYWQPGKKGALSNVVVSADALSLESIADDLRRITQDRGARAMTAALFRGTSIEPKLTPNVDGAIRRALTGLYVEHYLIHFLALTVAEIPGLEYYEQRHSEPVLSYRLLRCLATGTGISQFLCRKEGYGLSERIAEYSSMHRSALHIATNRLSVVVRGLASTDLETEFDWKAMPGIRRLVLAHYQDLPDTPPPQSYGEALSIGAQKTNAVCAAIAGKDDNIGALLNEHDRDAVRLLITTATDLEDRVLKDVFERERMYLAQPNFSGRSSIRFLGLYGGVHVHHVRSSAGGAGPSGAQAAVAEAIQRIGPQMIVSCGICAGLRPDRQKLCEVVVSTVVRHYDAQRVNEDKWLQFRAAYNIMPRGSRPDASALLLDRIRDLLPMPIPIVPAQSLGT